VITQVARGGSNPDVQRKAIQYLGVNGTQENRQALADIYAAATDVDIKRQILKAFMVSGDRARVLSAATTEKVPELRQEAVRQLGVMGAREELWQLYQKEPVVDVKKQILQGLFVGGDAAHLIEVANSEQNQDLRYTAVRQLGTMGRAKTGDALVAIYAREKEPTVKRQVIRSLFIQDNAESLVALARKESDPEMKKEIVHQLSLMKSKVALDYLLEILNK
jgi:HEAT repeat protein